MKITSKGQVTIPKRIRDAVGLHPNSEAEFEIVDGGALIRPVNTKEWEEMFEEWLRTAPRPREFTSDEIMEMTRGED